MLEVKIYDFTFYSPVPSYNWSRRDSDLPKQAFLESFERVLIIPQVHMEDQGEYICRAYNGSCNIETSIRLEIQAAPNFTIPLEDKHLDNHGNLTWICEAFGVPDVTYSWLKNGRLLDNTTLAPEDLNRYFVHENILRIEHLDEKRDSAMYQCRAKNQLKMTYSSAQLRVLCTFPFCLTC